MRKPIEGFEGLYDIDHTGKVYSLSREISKNDGTTQNLKERQLSPIVKDGYLRVVLYKNGKGHKKYLHVLVARHFIPNPKNKKEVNHIDGNKLNCHKDNLEWTTRSENIKHMWDTGLRK